MPIPTDPEQVAQLWAQRLTSARDQYILGVNGVTTSPMEQAANRSQAYVSGVQEAVQSGRWQAGLRRVTLQRWREAAIGIGAERLAGGAQAARPKVAAFMREYLPFLRQAVQTLDAQAPRGDFEANIRRMTEMARILHGFRRQGGGRANPMPNVP